MLLQIVSHLSLSETLPSSLLSFFLSLSLRFSATESNSQPDDTWRDIKALGYTKTLELLGDAAPPPLPKAKPSQEEAMGELRAALAELKVSPEAASAHRRVGECMQQLGREDAAKREFALAEELEKKASESVIDEQE